jgi:hypothetical protein
MPHKRPAEANGAPSVAPRPDPIEELIGKLRASEAVATVHVVTFERNTATGMWRARCATCGWITAGSEEQVQAAAGSHDQWQPVEVA